MNRMPATRISAAAGIGLLALVTAIAFALSGLTSPSAQADPPIIVGFDTNPYGSNPPPTGASESGSQCNNGTDDDGDTVVNDGCFENTATSLGASLEACRVYSVGQIFDIDLYIKDVPDLLAWEAYITYNKNAITITKPGDNNQNNNARFLFQQAQPVNNLWNTSETLPDTANPGIYRVGAVDLSVLPGGGDGGTGVLLRLQAQATANGTSSLNINPVPVDGIGEVGPWLRDSTSALINDLDMDGWFDGPIINGTIVVGSGSCTDGDGDTVPDSSDNCPTVSNPTQANFDGDSMGDACDPDDDNDGLLDTNEPPGCQFNPDCDGDLISDGNLDPDGFGLIVAGPDNCVTVANPTQTNTDGDALGDVCDPDDDNDTVADVSDNCPLTANTNQLDTDGDGQPGVQPPNPPSPFYVMIGGDACDLDDDNDGFKDTVEAFVGTSSVLRCADTWYPPVENINDEVDDQWPADINDDGRANLTDINLFFFPVRRFLVPANYDPRWDLNASGNINLADYNLISTVKPGMFNYDRAWTKQCIPD